MMKSHHICSTRKLIQTKVVSFFLSSYLFSPFLLFQTTNPRQEHRMTVTVPATIIILSYGKVVSLFIVIKTSKSNRSIGILDESKRMFFMCVCEKIKSCPFFVFVLLVMTMMMWCARRKVESESRSVVRSL